MMGDEVDAARLGKMLDCRDGREEMEAADGEEICAACLGDGVYGDGMLLPRLCPIPS